jgi:methylenetetrahydrofolate dehydrogenase (NADP+) / methenyltetrahydrofolate cyclohydrolase
MFTAMPTILDGKKAAEYEYSKILLELSLLPVVPKLVVVLVGEDPASETYVRSKTKKCLDLGIRGTTLQLPASIEVGEFERHLDRLNADKEVNGILVQLPLPKHLNRYEAVSRLSPLKDVDGLHPENMGLLMQGTPRLVPCTPDGILALLKFHQISLTGAKVVIVGRSDIVGKPMAQLCLGQNATVTVCHSKTKHLERETVQADILIAALGQKQRIGPEMVKEGAVVIDVGIHRTADKKLVGDVDFERVAPKVSAITPVPGGVGPMTIAMLMKNLVTATKLQSVK